MANPVEGEETSRVPGEGADEKDKASHGEAGASGFPASMKKSTVMRNWRTRLARVRLSAEDRPTIGAFSEVERGAVRVRAAVRKIEDPTSRTILVMRIFDGLNVGEVAQRLAIPEKEVGDRYREALRIVHKELGDWLPRNRPGE